MLQGIVPVDQLALFNSHGRDRSLPLFGLGERPPGLPGLSLFRLGRGSGVLVISKEPFQVDSAVLSHLQSDLWAGKLDISDINGFSVQVQ